MASVSAIEAKLKELYPEVATLKEKGQKSVRREIAVALGLEEKGLSHMKEQIQDLCVKMIQGEFLAAFSRLALAGGSTGRLRRFHRCVGACREDGHAKWGDAGPVEHLAPFFFLFCSHAAVHRGGR